MNLIGSQSKIKMLFIGPKDLVEELRINVPISWEIICVNSMEEFINSPSEINVILDSSIREIIDLNLIELSNVQIIACASTGTNHIKYQANKSDRISIYSLRDVPELLRTLTSAAEFSFGLLIALSKQIISATESTKSGIWNRTEFPGTILKGKQLGIIGFGRIGSAMASYANSFGMDVCFFDPYLQEKPTNFSEHDSIENLVANSDFISMHIPYLPDVSIRPVITREMFLMFKSGSYFINTSRGELIDEVGLISAIDSGRIRGAALDVLVGEPDISSNLIYNYAKETKANIIFTPHIAGYSSENVKVATMGILDHLVKQMNRD